MAAENGRRLRLLSMGEMLRQHAVSVVPDQNAAYLLVHRALTAALGETAARPADTMAASLRRDVDRLAAAPGQEAARHVG